MDFYFHNGLSFYFLLPLKITYHHNVPYTGTHLHHGHPRNIPNGLLRLCVCSISLFLLLTVPAFQSPRRDFCLYPLTVRLSALLSFYPVPSSIEILTMPALRMIYQPSASSSSSSSVFTTFLSGCCSICSMDSFRIFALDSP